ncbi:hypothetical protein PoB_002111200 [Plakobranchus ocellatus]|uniref:Uncharacterized protein n=1 Tax=Plakobranchus ocellatus TaxID=259542 RepID=A0AAV3ZH07_9GAST|nr:hypothetical protein PoB_002111200 [Plakobranchus ocellatus]
MDRFFFFFKRCGEACLQKCVFLGSDVTGQDVKEVLPDGTERDVSTKSDMLPFNSQGGIWKLTRAIRWWVQVQRDAGGNESVITYKCFAFDRTSGNNATVEVKVRLTN